MMPRYGRLYHHTIIHILLILYNSGCQSALNMHKIIGQREPGEATSSLIQASGLIASNNRTTSDELALAKPIQQHGNNLSPTKTTGFSLILQNNPNFKLNDEVLSQASNVTTTTIIKQSSDTNNTSNSEESTTMMKFVILANIIILIVGLCGNFVVIVVILRFTKSGTVTDIYILNLAFADLMFIFGLIFLITTMLIGHWVFGSLMCKLYMATTSLNQFASSLLLMVMSYDRYLAVCRPIKAQRVRHIRGAKLKCLAIWITCLMLMTPIIYFVKLSDDLTCAIFWPEWKSINFETVFTMYSFLLGFSVPLLLIAAFYFCVIRKLRLAASGPINTVSSRRSRSRETTNRRIEHLVIGIICTYIICWLPYWITQLCVSFSPEGIPPVAGFYECFLIATSLSYTNSALNPILYAFLSDNFKRRCTDVLRSINSLTCLAFNSKEAVSISRAPPTTTNCPEYQSEVSRPESRQTVVQFNTANKDTEEGGNVFKGHKMPQEMIGRSV